jgi:hypothetical protein
MNIRQANVKDVQKLIDIGFYFWNEAELFRDKHYPREIITHKLFNGIATNSIKIWLCEDDQIKSFIIFSVSQNFWDDKYQMSEVAWFCDPKFRTSLCNIRMIKVAEEWARNNKFSYVTMGAIKGPKSYDKLSKLYPKLGYNLLEKTYIKVL